MKRLILAAYLYAVAYFITIIAIFSPERTGLFTAHFTMFLIVPLVAMLPRLDLPAASKHYVSIAMLGVVVYAVTSLFTGYPSLPIQVAIVYGLFFIVGVYVYGVRFKPSTALAVAFLTVFSAALLWEVGIIARILLTAENLLADGPLITWLSVPPYVLAFTMFTMLVKLKKLSIEVLALPIALTVMLTFYEDFWLGISARMVWCTALIFMVRGVK